jgi:LacI family transcriptional regulator
MARALAELGHERIAIVTTTRMLSTIAHRVGGFTDALADLGLSVEPDDLIEGELSQEGGYAAVRQLLANGLAATAIFCVSDVMAIGALQALREGGVRVPSDVSLAGFDDIPIVRHLTPGLSTVALPLEQIGELVMTLASDEPRRTRRMRRIDAEVVLRGSTARRRH